MKNRSSMKNKLSNAQTYLSREQILIGSQQKVPADLPNCLIYGRLVAMRNRDQNQKKSNFAVHVSQLSRFWFRLAKTNKGTENKWKKSHSCNSLTNLESKACFIAASGGRYMEIMLMGLRVWINANVNVHQTTNFSVCNLHSGKLWDCNFGISSVPTLITHLQLDIFAFSIMAHIIFIWNIMYKE